jgi:rhomboid family GlyGly-CTERM serine protease
MKLITASYSVHGRDGSPSRPAPGNRGRLGEASLPAQETSRGAAPFRRPELFLFLALLALFNLPFAAGSWFHSMIYLPGAVQAGEWWRLFTHPFVHVTWYHLLLDGTAFLALYHSLLDTSLVRRLLYVVGAGLGSVLVAWSAAPGISTSGLCGLSGAAHGLMAVSALEMIAAHAPGSTERRIGQIGFILVVGKAALEAISGHMFFTWLHFGLMGSPVAVSHAGGIIGGLFITLFLKPRRAFLPR